MDAADAGGELVTVNEVLLLELQGDVLAGASDSIRQKIKLGQRLAVALVDDRAQLARSLQALHPLTVRRTQASALYHFSAESLARWVADEDTVVLGARLDGSIEAVSLFSVAGGHAEYHLNASSERGRDLAAWLLWQAIRRLRERGVGMLNLGGGAKPGDGVHQFKRRLGAAPAPLRAARQIYDLRRYRELCAAAGVEPAASRFPAYHASARARSGTS